MVLIGQARRREISHSAVAAESDSVFSLGRVIVPAQDSTLVPLGYNVASLGERALGFVSERKKDRAFVVFPELSLKLWLPFKEMVDLREQISIGNKEFEFLLPDPQELSRPMRWIPFVWFVEKLVQEIDPLLFMQVESSEEGEKLWEPSWGPIPPALTSKHPGDRFWMVSLAVDEIGEVHPQKWRGFLGESYLFPRIVPAGLHKIEVQFFFRLKSTLS